MRKYLAITVSIALLAAGLILGGNSLTDRAIATPGSISINEDPSKGQITVETDDIKAVWHYTARPAESNNQGGGNLYELYYKPMDAGTQRNLISFVSSPGWGNGSSGNIWPGVGGIGGTNLYATNQAPSTNATNSFSDIITDINLGADLQNYSAVVDGSGNAVLTFSYKVRSQSSNPANRAASGYWYRVDKKWTVEPLGAIRYELRWTILNDGYFSEPGVKANMSYNVGWDRYAKYGHDWTNSQGPSYLLGMAGIAGETVECWNSLNQFHADWIALTGSDIAPTVKLSADNGGRGFDGGGMYETGVRVWGSEANPTVEQCTIASPAGSLGTVGAHGIAWFGWWGGNPPNGSRYARLQSGTTWVDSFSIEMFQGPPGGGPDISNVNVSPIDSTRARINWNTDVEADSTLEMKTASGGWVVRGNSGLSTRNHSLVVSGLEPERLNQIQVKSRDASGNLAVSSGYEFSTSNTPMPHMFLSEQNAYWDSHTDYLNRLLSVEFFVTNDGNALARSVTLTQINSTIGVETVTALPIPLGDIDAGSSASFTALYSVSPGISRFLTVIHGVGQTPQGSEIIFPENTLGVV